MNHFLTKDHCIDCFKYLIFENELDECNEIRRDISWTQPSTRCYKCTLLLNQIYQLDKNQCKLEQPIVLAYETLNTIQVVVFAYIAIRMMSSRHFKNHPYTIWSAYFISLALYSTSYPKCYIVQ